MAVAANLRRFINPLWVANARARLRPQHMLTWGTLTFITTAFIVMIIYLTEIEQAGFSPKTAAQSFLLPVIIIQAIILMLFGTSRLGTGLVVEREQALIDYHRMTPMSPTAKIFGYLFGMPIREYFLFLLTMPFVIVGMVVGEVPLLTMLHFYLVFFTSVWLYHLTGLVTGMVAQRPRNGLIASMGIVITLYFVLPQFSNLGLTFFEFLTIRPTLFGLVGQQLETLDPEARALAAASIPRLDDFRSIRLYTVDVHPTLYTLLCQGLLIITMYVMIHRKWRDQEAHGLSKLQAGAVFFAGAAIVLGNFWPYITEADKLPELPLGLDETSPQEQHAGFLLALLAVSLGLCGGLALFLISVVSPVGHTIAKGWRLARKSGRTSLPIDSDPTSSLPLALFAIAVTGVVYTSMIVLAVRTGRFFEGPAPLTNLAAPMVLFACYILVAQAMRERLNPFAWFTTLFVIWGLPFFVTLILFAAYELWSVGIYIGLPCPIVSGGVSLMELLANARYLPGETPDFVEEAPFNPDAHTMLRVAVVGYSAAALAAQVSLWGWRTRIKGRELTAEDPGPLAAAA